MKNIIVILLVIFLCLVYYSCKEKSTQPTPVFEGITETLSDPTPIGVIDPDDWRPMMDCNVLPKVVQTSTASDTIPVVEQPDTTHLPKCTKIYPSYPNPSSNAFTVQYSLNASDSVCVTLNDSPTHILKVGVNERQLRGMYRATIDVSDLSSGIYRVYITVFRQTDILHSYGDVKIVK